MQLRTIEYYLIKNFLLKFILILSSFSLLIFIVNFNDLIARNSEIQNTFFIKLIISILSVPSIINEIAILILLISNILCFYSLSNKSEITIIRISGYSLWNICKPILKTSFILGVFWIIIFQPISIYCLELNDKLSKIAFKENTRLKTINKNATEKNNGDIWLRQENLDQVNQEMIINAKLADKDSLKFYNTTIWFFNEEGVFYKKIDSSEIIIENNKLILLDNIVNENFSNLYNNQNQANLTIEGRKNLNQKIDKIIIPTNLDSDFIKKKIINSSQNINNFNVFELPKIIKEMDNSGLNSQKFKIRFHSLLSTPLMFIAMSMISCYFGITHIRNNKKYLILFIGLIIGVFLYVNNAILISLGSSNLISIFASIWMTNLLYLSIGILLVYNKEKN